MIRSVAISIFAVVFVVAHMANAAVHQLSEDFLTWSYRDDTFTTADWDTTVGELRLPEFDFRIVGGVNFSGSARDVVVQGDVAYIASYSHGLVTVDIGDPTAPSVLDTHKDNTIYNYYYGVDACGDYAYLANKDEGLRAYDVSDPGNIVYRGSWNPSQYIYGVEVHGQTAFVAADDRGLAILDVTHPSAISHIASYTTTNARDVTLAGNYAFVADLSGGVAVIDVTDPANPGLATTISGAIGAQKVAVDGGTLAVATGAGGAMFYDVTEPWNPLHLATIATSHLALDIEIWGDLALVSDGDAGAIGIDISDPTTPAIVHGVATPDRCYSLAVAGDRLYAACDDDGGLRVIDANGRSTPVIVGSQGTPSNSRGIRVRGDVAYIADGWEGGLKVLDVSNPTAPTYLDGAAYASESAAGVEAAGNLVYVANAPGGLRVFDVSDPTDIVLGGFYPKAYTWQAVVVADHAYLACDSDGFEIVDITDPATMTRESFLDPGFDVAALAVAGNYAYLVGSGLTVVDISDPASPGTEGALSFGVSYGVAVAGDYAYVTCGSGGSGFRVIRVADPASPTEVGVCALAVNSRSVTVCGDFAYVGGYDPQMQIVDISDPTDPVVVETVVLPDNAHGVDVQGIHAWTAAENNGLQVLRIGTRQGLMTDENVARSLPLDDGDETVVKMALTAAATDSFSWSISADAGANWLTIPADGSWHAPAAPGADVLWSAALFSPDGVSNPACTNVVVEWLYDAATPDSLLDVPDDQGGWARLHFTRSGFDFADEATSPVTAYYVFRKVPESTKSRPSLSALPGADVIDSSELPPRLSGLPVVLRNCVPCVESTNKSDKTLPPGIWEVVGSVPAHQADSYVCLVPTLADSSAIADPTEYCVSAETTTPSVYFVSGIISGYSVDNIAPAAPGNFSVTYSTGGNHLSWDAVSDEDFQYYRVYLGDDPEFPPDAGHLVHTTIDVAWIDSESGIWNRYYKISAVDHVGNESAVVLPANVSGAALPDLDRRTVLHQNTPNPFNPRTVIHYEVPRAVRVSLAIYDLSGRRVRSLVDDFVPQGQREATWDGLDEAGRAMASGVYLCLLRTTDTQAARMITLLR